MDIYSFTILSILIFLIILYTTLLAFTKSEVKMPFWTGLLIGYIIVLISSWFVKELALQWVFIEASTLLAALLISMSRTERSIETAWKYLLLNSFSLGIAFLGLIILTFGFSNQVLEVGKLNEIKVQSNEYIQIGIFFIIFGYSGKLGLFPNHFWVSDTYTDSPSQIASALASFIPVSLCIALRPLIKMEREINLSRFNSVDFLLIIGIQTILYSIWTMYKTDNVRRLSALIAMFHTGVLSVVLWLNPNDKIFYFILSGTLVMKVLLFSGTGLFRLDTINNTFEGLKSETHFNRTIQIIYFLSISFALVFPFSPVFLSDLFIIKLGLKIKSYWILLIPILGVIAYGIFLHKILFIMNKPNREIFNGNQAPIRIRMFSCILLLLINILICLYGFYVFGQRGFSNA